jgi:hypothetical protein
MRVAVTISIEPVVELVVSAAVGHVGEHRAGCAGGQVMGLLITRDETSGRVP